MYISLSEVETVVSKATEAVGLSPGLGEDAGRAARYMMACGVGSLMAFVDALEAVDEGLSTGFDIESAITGAFNPKSTDRTLSALCAGPSACDLILSWNNAEWCDSPIILKDVDVPVVILFEILVASSNLDKNKSITWTVSGGRVAEAVCWRGSLAMIKGEFRDLLIADSTKIMMRLATWDPNCLTMIIVRHLQREAAEVDGEMWLRIKGYADRLLVESTEASRLTGAGSGIVVDTD